MSRVHAHIQLHQTKGGRTIPQVFNTKSHKRIFIFSQAEAKRAFSSDVSEIWAPRSGRLDLGDWIWAPGSGRLDMGAWISHLIYPKGVKISVCSVGFYANT